MNIEKGINPNCSELIIRLGKITKREAKKLLKQLGIKEVVPRKELNWPEDNPFSDSRILIDEDNRQLAENPRGGVMFLERDPDYGNDLVVVYHQHCQPEGFPTLYKISKALGEEVIANDGGYIDEYENFYKKFEEFKKNCPNGTLDDFMVLYKLSEGD